VRNCVFRGACPSRRRKDREIGDHAVIDELICASNVCRLVRNDADPCEWALPFETGIADGGLPG
jgi:hypothetical protein